MNNYKLLPKLATDAVYKLLENEVTIENVFLSEKIDLRTLACPDTNSNIPKKVTFRNCYITDIDARDCGFEKLFTLSKCLIVSASFEPSYFLGGATFDGCEFINDIGFLTMGGSSPGKPLIVRDCVFHGFVNMFDAWFEGPVEISRCSFPKGTNLLGNKGKPYQVRFEVTPILKDNAGKMDVDNEMN